MLAPLLPLIEVARMPHLMIGMLITPLLIVLPITPIGIMPVSRPLRAVLSTCR